MKSKKWDQRLASPAEMTKFGDAAGKPNAFPGRLSLLNERIGALECAHQGSDYWIIPQRLPRLTWHEARNGDPMDPSTQKNLFARMVDSANEREAVAMMWEVQTAQLQAARGDANAGLTATERAVNDSQFRVAVLA